MVGDSSLGSGHARDEAQGIEVLRAGLLTQETTLRTLAKNVDCIFQVLEGRFDEIADRLDALAIGSNKGRNKGMRRLREDVAQGQPVNRPILARHCRQPIYNDDSKEKEDFLYAD